MDPRGERERRVVRQMLEEYVLAKGVDMVGSRLGHRQLMIAPTVPSLQSAHREAGGVILRRTAQGEISPRLLQLSYLPCKISLSFF